MQIAKADLDRHSLADANLNLTWHDLFPVRQNEFKTSCK